MSYDGDLLTSYMILGGSEGTFYYPGKTVVDLRYAATQITGSQGAKSGLTFGLSQIDTASNTAVAFPIYKAAVLAAIKAGRIGADQEHVFLDRVTTRGFALTNPFTKAQLNTLDTQVLPYAKAAIDKADLNNIKLHTNQTRALIAAVQSKWGSAGVFDPTNGNYLLAYGNTVAWANRSGDVLRMQRYLTGEKVGTLAVLTATPTIADVKNYLLATKQYDPNQTGGAAADWKGVQGRIVAGYKALSGQPDAVLAIAHSLPGSALDQVEALLDVAGEIRSNSPKTPLPTWAQEVEKLFGDATGTEAKALVNTQQAPLIVTAPDQRKVTVTQATVNGQIVAKGTNAGVDIASDGTVNNGGWQIGGDRYGISIEGVGTIINQGVVIGQQIAAAFIQAVGQVINRGSMSGASGLQIGSTGTLDNSGSIKATSGTAVSITGGGTVTNEVSGQIVGTSGGLSMGAAGDVADSGTIDASSGTGVNLNNGGTVKLDTAASIVSGRTYGIYAASGTTTVSNAGSISGTTNLGVYIGGRGSVSNTRAISGGGGVQIGGTGTIANSGAITATGGTAAGIGGIGSITNEVGAKIVGTSGGVSIGGVGKLVDDGAISASSGIGANLNNGGSVELGTSATVISGKTYGIYAASGATAVTNKGKITGTDNAGVYIGGTGSLTNASTIAGANGVLIGGKGTVANTGTVTATSGTAVSIGGTGTVVNNTGDVLKGTSGGVSIGGSGKLVDDGAIRASSGTGVNLNNGGRVELGTSATMISGKTYGIYAASGATAVTNKGKITGTDNAGVYIGGTGSLTNASTITGANGVLIGGKGTVANTGTVTATSGTAVSIGGTGTVVNNTGDVLKGTSGGVSIGGIGKLIDDGAIRASSGIGANLNDGGSVVLGTSATVISGKTYGIYAASGATAVTNKGKITGTNNAGVSIGGTGSLNNASTIAGANGVLIGGKGTVANTGTVTATSGTAVSIGGTGTVTNDAGKTLKGTSGGVSLGGVGTLVDDGTISASDGIGADMNDGGSVTLSTSASIISGKTYGVYGASGATAVSNAGKITGTKNAGVYIGGSDGTVTNTGTITGAVGVILSGNGNTLRNMGIIEGTDGVAADIGSGNTLALGGGGGFVGKVITQGEQNNRLELLSGGDGNVLSGLGTVLQAFGSLLVDGGGDWELDGDNDIGSLDDEGGMSLGYVDDSVLPAAATPTFAPSHPTGGSLTVSGDLKADGVIALSSGADLQVGGALTGSGRIALTSGAQTVTLDTATTSAVAFSGFSAGDGIDLTGLSFASSFATEWLNGSVGGTLEIVDKAHQNAVVASLAFSDLSSAAGFTLKRDSSGGTVIGTKTSAANAMTASASAVPASSNGAAHLAALLVDGSSWNAAANISWHTDDVFGTAPLQSGQAANLVLDPHRPL